MLLLNMFRRYGFMVFLIAALMINAGCPGNKSRSDNSEPQTKEELWVSQFKKDLDKSEKRFFEARYIQNSSDPFYLQEVLANLSASKPPTKAQKAQIDIHRDDFEESWPLLTKQLSRIQLIFAVTAVVPAYKATLLLITVNNSLDVENAKSIAAFKELVLKGTVFNSVEDQLDLSPEAKGDVVNLANAIAKRTMVLLTGAMANKLPPAVQTELALLRNEIRLLNPEAAEAVGLRLTAEEIPFVESPLKLWADLKDVYDRIFGVLSDMTKLGSLTQDLAKSRSIKEKKALKFQIESMTADVKVKLESISPLRTKEAELLNKLSFATEKQFSIAKALTKAE